MTNKPHIVERAYQIARLGKVRSTEEVINQLNAEGYENSRQHIAGSLRTDLRKLLNGALSAG